MEWNYSELAGDYYSDDGQFHIYLVAAGWSVADLMAKPVKILGRRLTLAWAQAIAAEAAERKWDMKKCTHSRADREAAEAGGMCCLCLAADIGKMNDACVKIRRKLETENATMDDLIEGIYIYVHTLTPESLNERFQWIKNKIDSSRAAQAAERSEQ